MIEKQKRNSDLILVFGQLLAQLSDRMTSLGLIWMVTQQFGEKWVTWYLVVGGLPHLVLSPFTGRVIQKFGALKVVVYADWIRSILYVSAIFLIPKVVDHNDLIAVMSLVFVANCFSAFFNPGILSLPLEIYKGEGVQKLTARLSAVTSLSTILGPVLGLLCFQRFGLTGLFSVTGFAYFASGYCASLVKTPGRENILPNHAQSYAKSVSLFSSLNEKPLIPVMLGLFLLMNLLLSPIQVLMPYMAKNIFGSFNSLATMEVAIGLGVLGGGLILSFISVQKKVLRHSYFYLLGLSFFFVGLQYSKSLMVAAGALLLMGLFIGLANVIIINIFQTEPDEKHIPNIMSLVNLISTAAVPVSLLGVGALQVSHSIETIGLYSALALFLICLLSFLPLRKFGKELM